MISRPNMATLRSLSLAWLIAAADAQNFKTMTMVGCYSSSGNLVFQGSYQYQSTSYCQGQCVNMNKAVTATTKGSDCWCGDLLPSSDDKVDDSQCSTKCNGYGQFMCKCSIPSAAARMCFVG